MIQVRNASLLNLITNGLRFKKTEKNVIRYIKRDDLGIKHDLMIEHF